MVLLDQMMTCLGDFENERYTSYNSLLNKLKLNVEKLLLFRLNDVLVLKGIHGKRIVLLKYLKI